MKFWNIIREWMLVIVMVAGALSYLVYHNVPALHPAGPVLYVICTRLQPVLLFCMLFLAFCKVEPRQFRFERWHWWMLAFQCASFILIAALLIFLKGSAVELLLLAFMLCMICPTGTATPVMVNMLGGDISGVVAYTVLINVAVAVLIPLSIPLLYPSAGMSFVQSFLRIIAKVFPLLVLPCLAAWFVRYFMPAFHSWCIRNAGASFYMWAVSLMIAIIISTRALVNSGNGWMIMIEMIAVSLLSCAVQYAFGRWLGHRYGREITARQTLGQKNTSFGIWMGYTFFNPVVSVAYGFYSIWQNAYNTLELRKYEKSKNQQI